MDGLMDLDLSQVDLFKIDEKFYLKYKDENSVNLKIGYDKIIRCLGFKFDFSLFNRFQ